MWNVLENGYLDPHAMTRIDFSKERGRVSYNQFPLLLLSCVYEDFMGKLFSNCSNTREERETIVPTSVVVQLHNGP